MLFAVNQNTIAQTQLIKQEKQILETAFVYLTIKLAHLNCEQTRT